MAFASVDVDELVRYFCINPSTAQYGPYRPLIGDGAGRLAHTELIPGSLYRYRLVDTEGLPVDLQIYTGIVGLGGQLWEQEIRVLLKVAMGGHPGLPEILGGGFQDHRSVDRVLPTRGEPGVAFVATRGSSSSLASEGNTEYMAEPSRRREALRQFMVLANALAALHALGVCHRNLWPGTIDAKDDFGLELRIARFEMSALLANLVNNEAIDRGGGHVLRSVYEQQPLRSFAYCPPERIPFLFPETGLAKVPENEKADVYSLGVIVWEWFCGPLPGELVPRRGAPVGIGEQYDGLRKHLEAVLGSPARHLPRQLTALLRGMLEENPEHRLSASEVLHELTREYARILAHWRPEASGGPMYVAFMPAESTATIYQWNWLDHPPTERTGREELRALIETDLRDAKLYYSPHGAEPFIRDVDPELLRDAKHLLLGKRAAWFCTPFRLRTGLGGRFGPPMDQLVVIKYVAPLERQAVRDRLDDLFRSYQPAPLRHIVAVATDTDPEWLQAEVADGLSWSEQFEPITVGRTVTEQELKYEQAINWLLEYQGVELRSRTYACTAVDRTPTTLTVVFDPARDARYSAQSPMLGKFNSNSRLRPQLGDFFTSLNEEGGTEVRLVPDDRGRPSRNTPGIRAWVEGLAGPDRVRLRLRDPGAPVPEECWISPGDDRGTTVALRRQAEGRWDLFDNRPLLAQLRRPMSIRMLPDRWRRAGAGLSGDDAKEAVRSILTHEPFFALQGPPGTGKTTVAAEAVAHYLQVNPGARVLVSAQSNYALDNLARRILERVGAIHPDGSPTKDWDGVAQRIPPSETERLDPVMRDWTGDRLADRRARQIRNRPPTGRDIGAHTQAVLADWHNMLRETAEESVLPELGDRLRRAANLVFATCSMATAGRVTPSGSRSSVDWVVVEEAAKAWPTELAVPLCRGARWTLIGDHNQLPAHRHDDVERFLDSCVADPDPNVAVSAKDRDEYLRAFNLFRTLFREPGDEGAGLTMPPSAVNRPLATLRTQYRMRPQICEVVGRVFYPRPGAQPDGTGLRPGMLSTGRSIPEAPIDPSHWLSGRSLVWLDTDGVADCGDEPQWRNPGEARIVRDLVADITGALRPPHGVAPPGLAVLSPYRRQNELLQRYDAVSPVLHTIHAFQGREADIIVVSLVRDRSRRETRTAPWAGLGHLSSAQLTNVLLSRARQLLVVVGNFTHFSSIPQPAAAASPTSEVPTPAVLAGLAPARPARLPAPRSRAVEPGQDARGAFWPDVCSAFAVHGDVVKAADLFPWRGGA